MGPWPVLCAQAGAGCPGWGPDVRRLTKSRMSGPRPDVRAGVAGSSALWMASAGFPGRRRMSGQSRGAEYPALAVRGASVFVM